MNAAANHAILPRNGRNIDLATVGAAVLLAYNMTHETMLVVGTPGLTTSTTGNASTFHLSDLAQHSPQAVEHDASLSRQDTYFGNGTLQNDFSWKAWARTLDSWGNATIIDASPILRCLINSTSSRSFSLTHPTVHHCRLRTQSTLRFWPKVQPYIQRHICENWSFTSVWVDDVYFRQYSDGRW